MKLLFISKKHTIKLSIILISICLIMVSGCAQKHASDVTLDKKIGQMLKIGFRGLEAPPESSIAEAIKKYHIGGVVLFDYDVPKDTALRNIESPAQLNQLTSQLQKYADIPLLIAIDQEGGKVARLKPLYGFPASVSAEYLGSLDNVDSTKYYAGQIAETLKKAGINTNLAPVVDLNTNPDNPVIGGLDRSYSADPETVVRHAEIYINQMHKNGIITTLKHFPGHGSSEDDSHKGITDVTKTWQRKELLPYRKLIANGTADIVMTAHIYNAKLDSTYPATLSKPIITGILRDSLGFEGVVMSDDLQMGAIRKYYNLKETIKQSILAGVDILSFANNSVYDPEIAAKAHGIIKELIKEKVISEERINESYQRIMKLKERLNK